MLVPKKYTPSSFSVLVSYFVHIIPKAKPLIVSGSISKSKNRVHVGDFLLIGLITRKLLGVFDAIFCL